MTEQLWQRALEARRIEHLVQEIVSQQSEEQRLSRKAKAQNRCRQCWQRKPPAEFLGARGRPVFRCADCRARYTGWENKTLEEKLQARAARVDPAPQGRVL